MDRIEGTLNVHHGMTPGQAFLHLNAAVPLLQGVEVAVVWLTGERV